MWVSALPAVLFLLAANLQIGNAQQQKPVFTDTAAIKEGTSFVEDTPTGTVIATVTAYDPDGTKVTYSLSGEAAEYLEINPDTGEIRVTSQLDFERNPTLSISVTATDEDGDFRTYGSDLQIGDANDIAPVFSETVYNFELLENTTVGFNVSGLIRVDDRDTRNDLIRVTCDDSTESLRKACDVFSVVDRRISNKFWEGDLFLQKSLDFEVETSYSVRLIAFDGKNLKLQEVQIGVKDINDSPPYFIRAQGQVINEGRPIGSYIDYVSAVDQDIEERRPIRYELYGDPEALKYFNVDYIQGNITTKLELDYDDPNLPPEKEFTLQVRARELLGTNPDTLGDNDRTTATAVVKIRLTDINDNCPQFNEAFYQVEIGEDIAQGSNIPLQMTVTDRDSGPRSTFDLALSDNSGIFEVTPRSGRSPASVTIRIANAGPIDYETVPRQYSLTVEARENGDGIINRCTGTTTIQINLRDVNDENPEFPRNDYTTDVFENAAGGTSLITITAADRDSGVYGEAGIRYSLIGSGVDLFDIDQISGVVTVKACDTPGRAPCIDFEQKERYDLAVRAQDNLGIQPGSRPGTSQLTINIKNINDNPPTFNILYLRTILEGERFTMDPLVIRAEDRDGERVTYSIPSGQADAQLWQVDEFTGNITATRAIQFTDPQDKVNGVFKFEAQASDGTYDTVVSIEIRVIDINDKVPTFLPTNYQVSIPEDTPGGSFVLVVSVTDLDSPTTGNGQVDVTAEEGSFGKFTTRPNGTLNGVVMTEIITSPDATFDADVQSFYTVVVRARDRGSPSKTGTATVTVYILDTNNKNPYFDPPTTSVQVYENKPVGFLVTSVTAKDRDTDQQLEIKFADPIRAFNPSGVEVTDSSLFKDLFSIDKDGFVRVNKPLDRDVVNFMTYTLYVEDTRATPVQSGTGALFIRILEYNDQAPYFELPFYNLSILEERPLSSFVGSLLARDEDDQIRSYQLVDNPGDLLSISLSSGVLRVNGRLDYEARQSVDLVAMAFDNGSPSLSNTTRVRINIININDNTPVFNQSVYQVNLLEHTTRTDALITVSASDKDLGDYGVVRYSANNEYFRVDELTGQIYLKPNATLDREVKTTHTFQVTAYDSPLDASVRLNTTAPVYVSLLDINDNCPIYKASSYSRDVIETADPGDQVLELFADDKDEGINGINRRISFSIVEATANPPLAYQLFSIRSVASGLANVESAGRIEVRSSLRNQAGLYNFTVVASDKNGNNATGDMCSTPIQVTVRVQEAINDAPIWVLPPSSNYSIDVLESQYNGMLVYDCHARDINRGNAGIIDYSFNVQQRLTEYTDEFRINPVTCVIRAQIVYDREQVDSYVLTLVAKDRGDPSASSETVLIINVLDVNDNEPRFPMRNGETIDMDISVREGPIGNGVLGQVSATDADTDHKNNKIYYKFVAGNDDGTFLLDRENGTLSINPLVAPQGLDREKQEVYSMDILAYNEVNDDTVIRQRRRRSTNPSVITVNIALEDVNDSPPMFTGTDYHGCIPLDSRFGQSVLKVEAVDPDLRTSALQYSVISETTGGYFSVDSTLGVIRNSKLLSGIESRQPILQVRVDDDAAGAQTNPLTTAQARVKIFVTDSSNEVVMEVGQPSADVRNYKDQLMRVMQSSPSIDYVCIREIRDHHNDDGSVSYVSSDVYVSAVGQNAQQTSEIYSGERLRTILMGQLDGEVTAIRYGSLHVKSVMIDSDDGDFEWKEDSVLAIFIIALLLIFLALLLFCLACFCIRNSKKKKIKKLRAVQNTEVEVVRHEPPPAVVTSVNPVYDNKAYVVGGDEFSVGNEEYAVVQRRAPMPVSPPIVPVVIPAEPLDDDDDEREVVYVTEPVPDIPPRSSDEEEEDPEPVIITEPIMSEEVHVMAPPPADFYEPEPRIETEVLEEDEVPSSFGIPGDEIDVEIRDSPPNSLPPPTPPASLPATSPPPSLPAASPPASPQVSIRASPQVSIRASPPDSPAFERPASPALSEASSPASETEYHIEVELPPPSP